MTAKHTPGRIHARPRFDLVDDDGSYFATATRPADVARLALCWNMHDRLIEKLLHAADLVAWSEGEKTAEEFYALLAEIDRT